MRYECELPRRRRPGCRRSTLRAGGRRDHVNSAQTEPAGGGRLNEKFWVRRWSLGESSEKLFRLPLVNLKVSG